MKPFDRSVLIIGAGAVGGVFGAALHAAGWHVRFRIRENAADACREHDLRVVGPDGDTWLPPECFAPTVAGERFAIVLIAVKMPDLVAALERATTGDDDERAIVTLQNGMDAPSFAAARFGRARVLAGAAVINAARDAPPDGQRLGAHVVRMRSAVRRLALAPMHDVHLPRAQAVAAALSAAGIEATASADASKLLWHKFAGLEPLATACALSQRTLGELRDDPASRGLLRGLFGETVGLARALHLVDEAQVASRWQAYLDGPRQMLPSLAIDIARGAPPAATELLWLTGAVVSRARRRNVPAPLHEAALTALTRRPAQRAQSVAELLATDLPLATVVSLDPVRGDRH